MSRFRDFLREKSDTPKEEELLAAKLMGRWRGGGRRAGRAEGCSFAKRLVDLRIP